MARTVFYVCDGKEYQLALPSCIDGSSPRDLRAVLYLIARDLWDNHDDWDTMTDDEKHEAAKELWNEVVQWGYEEIELDEEEQ